MQIEKLQISRKDGKILFYTAPNATLIDDFDRKLEAFLCAAVDAHLQRKAARASQVQLARIARMTK